MGRGAQAGRGLTRELGEGQDSRDWVSGMGPGLGGHVRLASNLKHRNPSASDIHPRNRTPAGNVSMGTDDAIQGHRTGPGAIPRTEGGKGRMLARHRQSLILQAVRSDGSARVSDLTQQLGVSDMTIRRDLEVLAKDGLVEKVHGGAVLPGSHNAYEPSLEDRLVLERPEKTSIARAAASLVRPGTAIAIAAGSTTFSLAQCLLDVPGLTIVTNSLRVANLYTGNRGPDGTSVLVTGGMRATSDALVGPVADLTIRSLHFDTLFIGCTGIDAEVGLTTPNLAEAETNRSLIKVARRVVVLADHTKWGVVSLASFATLDEVNVLVTDSLLSADAQAILTTQVGEVLV